MVTLCSEVMYLFLFFRGLNQLPLPDQEVGVALYNGQMTGLTNLSRRGDALLEASELEENTYTK